MLMRKCDICGREIRKTEGRYKLVFIGRLYDTNKDVCADCIKRIADEIKQADTPQTDMAEDIVKSYGFSGERYREAKAKTEPQTDQTDCSKCETYWNCQGQCDEIPQIEDEPQTDCAWK